jgi:hypothetical protein
LTFTITATTAGRMSTAHQLTSSARASRMPMAIMHSNSKKLAKPPTRNRRNRSART